jgi:hypothetical protein
MPTEGLMPGMATVAQLDALRNADGAAADSSCNDDLTTWAASTYTEVAAQAERVGATTGGGMAAQTSEIYMNELQAKGGRARNVAQPTAAIPTMP